MSDEKCCCNCLHCARWHTSKGVKCHCDLDDKYLSYLTVMDTDIGCNKWEKETKWESQEKHDDEIWNQAIDEFSRWLFDKKYITTDNWDMWHLDREDIVREFKERKNG